MMMLMTRQVKHDDLKSAEDVLALMQALEGDKAGEAVTDVMAFYAVRGDVANTERLLHTYQLGGSKFSIQSSFAHANQS